MYSFMKLWKFFLDRFTTFKETFFDGKLQWNFLYFNFTFQTYKHVAIISGRILFSFQKSSIYKLHGLSAVKINMLNRFTETLKTFS